jgi:hypothetical protein
LPRSARRLAGQVAFGKIHQIDRGMDFHAQFGDPPIDETAQITHLSFDGFADYLLYLLCLVRHCARPLSRNGHLDRIAVNIR